MFYTIEQARAKYPTMTGTDKQIAYAASIRDELTRTFKADLSRQQKLSDTYTALLNNTAQIAQVAKSKNMTAQQIIDIATEAAGKATARIDELTARIENKDASWWIDNRCEY